MGAPVPEMTPETNPADEASAEALLSSLRTIAAAERRKHASVYNYWLSIRGSREFPPIHDLDPLEISDAGAFSILLEMIGGGEDAEIRHLGGAISGGIKAEKISEAPNPSLLASIATRLPVVAACRDAFAFEDEFETAEGKTRCWVSLLPFSATGTWIDFVYGFVSLDRGSVAAQPVQAAKEEGPAPEEAAEALGEPVAEDEGVLVTQFETSSLLEADENADDEGPGEAEPGPLVEDAGPEATQETIDDEHRDAKDMMVEEEAAFEPESDVSEPLDLDEPNEPEEILEPIAEPAPAPAIKPGFSKKFLETLASVKGFYGNPVEVELDPDTVAFECGEEPEPMAESPVQPAPSAPPSPTLEGNLQIKLTDVRAKADEARQAKLRANAALYEGLSAAYDFALDAEDSPEEYLKLVQAEGLKIQLRSPMKPVAKLAFDGMCDDATIEQLEAILSWAFKEELPRGTLAERIEAVGGIAPILSGAAKAA